MVDPISTGANVADALLRRGVAVVAVTSGPAPVDLPIDATLRTDYAVSLVWDEQNSCALLPTLRSLPFALLSVLIGSEMGILCGDYLAAALGLPGNSVQGSDARRNKWNMQEKVRKMGLRAPRQACAGEWGTVMQFLQQINHSDSVCSCSTEDQTFTAPIVLKPTRSAGSDHIFKVHTLTEARSAFNSILCERNVFGRKNREVVCQEFLEGKEYVVDAVSKNGVHKIIALWEYDKRSVVVEDATGVGPPTVHDFVYFGQASMSGQTKIAKEVVEYTLKVLDALEICHGASHAEIIFTTSGPCLVEVGARPQGCEGTFIPLADACWGYNQVGALVASVIAPEEFDALPMVCGEEKQAGFKVDFVCGRSGKLKQINHLDKISQLASFLRFDLLPALGNRMRVTIDCFTSCGSVSLVHPEREVLMQDVETIREMEKTMWVVEEEAGQA